MLKAGLQGSFATFRKNQNFALGKRENCHGGGEILLFHDALHGLKHFFYFAELSFQYNIWVIIKPAIHVFKVFFHMKWKRIPLGCVNGCSVLVEISLDLKVREIQEKMDLKK